MTLGRRLESELKCLHLLPSQGWGEDDHTKSIVWVHIPGENEVSSE